MKLYARKYRFWWKVIDADEQIGLDHPCRTPVRARTYDKAIEKAQKKFNPQIYSTWRPVSQEPITEIKEPDAER